LASVAELKAAIDAAIQQISEGQTALRAASEKLSEAQQSLAAALEGSGHEQVTTAHGALSQAATDLEECLHSTLAAVEQAQTYAATL
jgi:uncharacterized protein YukE